MRNRPPDNMNDSVRTPPIDDDRSIVILNNIFCLLKDRLEPRTKKKPWWKKRRGKIFTLLIGLTLLFFLDFPTDRQKQADVIVPNHSIVEIKLGKNKEIKEFFDRINSLTTGKGPKIFNCDDSKHNPPTQNIQILNELLILKIELFKKEWKYAEGHVVSEPCSKLVNNVLHDVFTIKPTNLSDLLSSPSGPMNVINDTILKLNIHPNVIKIQDYKEKLLRFKVGYSLFIGEQEIPLIEFVREEGFKGQLHIATKPNLGIERFRSNLQRAFGILF